MILTTTIVQVNLQYAYAVEVQDSVERSFILNTDCKGQLVLVEKMHLNVSPCEFWKATHDGQPCMALKYHEKVNDKVQFSEFIKDLLYEKHSILTAFCAHLDDKLSDNPILLFEPKQPLKDYCTSSKALSEVDQLTILRDVALGTLGFLSHTNMELKVTVESIFVHKNSDGEIQAFFAPMYGYSCFLQDKQNVKPSSELPTDYTWVKHSLLLMHYQDKYNEHTELPESHILYNIFKYKWFSKKDSLRPKNAAEVADEISYILGKLMSYKV